MPTQTKIDTTDEIRKLIEECTVAITADFSGLPVDDMNSLRRSLRESGVTFRVVKNRLTYLAADAAGRPNLKDVVHGPTGLAFGFGDPVDPAKALTQFVQTNRSPLQIKGGVMGDRTLTPEDIGRLAALPTRDVLLSQLLGQIQAPATSLAYVLSAPVGALARVLQRRIEADGGDEGAAGDGESETVETPEEDPADESE